MAIPTLFDPSLDKNEWTKNLVTWTIQVKAYHFDGMY